MDSQNVGLVFADISGTTRLHGKIGTGEALHALDRCVRRIERVIDGNGGRVLMPAVDEMISVFPDADRAVQAAIEMQERVADLPPVSGIKLAIRIGVHFGAADETANELSGEAVDAGKALLMIAGPRQIVTCAQTAEALSPGLARCLNTLEDTCIAMAGGECQVYSVAWEGGVSRQSVAATSKAPPPNVSAPMSAPRPAEVPAVAAVLPVTERVCVRYLGKAFLVDDKTPSLTLGRDRDCDIVIGDRKASRQHARIEKRGKQHFFLVDTSTNGTFVLIEGQNETLVRNEEIRLSGRGRFSCGHSTANPDAEVADFETL